MPSSNSMSRTEQTKIISVLPDPKRSYKCTGPPRSHRHAVENGEKEEVVVFEPKLKHIGGKIVKSFEDPFNILRRKLKVDSKLRSLILKSLAKAREESYKLDDLLRENLDWPLTIREYMDFLDNYSRWIPLESGNPAFMVPGSPGQYQEGYDRLLHFHFLIDQPINSEGGVPAQNDPWFREWLVIYANYWGTFLDTTDSFNDDILQSLIDNAPQYRVNDSRVWVDGKLVPNDPSGWLTFNQFFARELNPGLRPIEHPNSNKFVVGSADCTFMEKFPIDANSNVIAPGPRGPRIKKTHAIGNIEKLLEGSKYKSAFANGDYIHFFLNTFSYHRFHAPVSGKLVECRAIQGLTYLDVTLKNGGFDAPDSALDGYEFYQSRGLTVWDTRNSKDGNIGLVAVLPVGMAQVSSVHMTGTVNKEFYKGEEYGYFQFGGSDIILLFQKGVVNRFTKTDPKEYLHYGTSIAECNVSP